MRPNQSGPPGSSGNKNAEDRRLNRMQQMEMMEAAARGTAPSMQLDTADIHIARPTSTSGLRSRSTSEARRFLQEEEDDLSFPQSNSAQNIPPPGSRTSTNTAFFQRGDLYGVDQSVNLMDASTNVYTAGGPSSRTRTSFIDIFIGGAGSTSGHGNTRRGNVHTTWQQSLGGRMVILALFLGFGLFLAFSVSFLIQDPDENQGLGGIGIGNSGNRFDDIKAILLLNSASHTEYLQDDTTPAFHALRWLTVTDPAQLEPNDSELLARFALASFYYATHPKDAPAHSSGKVKTISSGWKHDDNWMSKASVCEWYGVDCESMSDGGGQDVVHFNLTSNQVVGPIPLELRSLSNMVLMDLSSNKLTGPIPIPICRMFQITYLLLHNNQLTGSIPTHIGFLEGAYELYLSNNNFTSTIPDTISKLSNLRALYLGNNDLTGSIPNLAGLKDINHLHMNDNQLSGALPFTISKLTQLYDLRLENNQITGIIPPEIASNKKLRLMYLGNNHLTGKIPDIFDDLHTLTDMELHNNRLNGKLPTTFGALGGLRRLSLDANRLAGSIPTEWGGMTSIEVLTMHHNELVDTIPTEFASFTNLKDLFLNHNYLQGELPTQLAMMTNMRALFLEHNAFRGTVPDDFAQLTSLVNARLFKNLLTGTIPSQFCNVLKGHKEAISLEADCKSKVTCTCCTACH